MFRFRIPFIDSRIVVGGAREGLMTMTSSMSLKVIRSGKRKVTLREWFVEMRNLILRGDRQDYGVVSRKVVTTEGVRMLADLIANDSNSVLGAVPTPGAINAHYWGIGTAAEAVGNTWSTMSSNAPTDGIENAASGTHVSGTSSTNATYTSVATITATEGAAITEHAIGHRKGDDSALALLDRHKFDAINVVTNDSIQFTYVLTLNAGT